MSNIPLRFALVGCGRIAKNHVGPLADLPDFALVAVCDLLGDRADALARTAGVPAYTNYHEMLAREQVDIVSILTPSGMHPAHAIDIIERYRKHVVIEKPMALAFDDIARMREAAARVGVKIFPVYQNRYNLAVQRVRQDLLSGALGKPVLGTVRVRWSRGAAYYARDPWRGTWAMDGGALTNQGIHYIDLLQYLMGDVEAVNALTATRLVDVEVEDTAVATVTFASGALGVIEVTTAARPVDFEASISVLAEKGTAVLTGIAANQLETYTLDPQARAASSEEFPDAYGFGHWPFFRDVAADLRGERPHPISMDEGTGAIRLLNAIYRSAEDRREVRLDEGAVSRRLGRPDASLTALYTTPFPASIS
jgi:UDP-N-acetyl-2-amino-2-deoxyglucuronate dehydrogenase